MARYKKKTNDDLRMTKLYLAILSQKKRGKQKNHHR